MTNGVAVTRPSRSANALGLAVAAPRPAAARSGPHGRRPAARVGEVDGRPMVELRRREGVAAVASADAKETIEFITRV